VVVALEQNAALGQEDDVFKQHPVRTTSLRRRMMSIYFRAVNAFLVALIATLFWGPTERAAGGDIHYLFDFNDKKVPDVLDVNKYSWGDEPTASLTYSATSGRLQITDTKHAASAVGLTLDQEVADTHLSAVVDPQGKFVRGVPFFIARDRNFLGHDDSYWCFIWPFSDGNGLWFTITKNVNGQEVFHVDTATISTPPYGPYLMQFDVVDGVSATGRAYTDLTTRLTDKNDWTWSRSYRDWDGVTGLGGYSRIPSGQVSFGAGLDPDHRNRGWALNVTLDDVSITATTVPEPNTLLLLSAGTVGLLAIAWRRRKRG
jgi:hypothetical protein